MTQELTGRDDMVASVRLAPEPASVAVAREDCRRGLSGDRQTSSHRCRRAVDQ